MSAVALDTGGRPDLVEERRLWRSGLLRVAGVDEVGRGAWAGPLSVGVAVVTRHCRSRSVPPWLRDSKLLAEERREGGFDELSKWCAEWSVGHASPAECDRWGMTRAWREALLRALAGLHSAPDALLVDGPWDLVTERSPVDPTGNGSPAPVAVPGDRVPVPPPTTVVPVVKGDLRCVSIAAASVLAKVSRDRIMRAEAPNFPGFDFEMNKGYPSPTHKTALRGYGMTAIHRRTWSFVERLPTSYRSPPPPA